ncbi:MAG TPA: PfkB family carbohydrate kinase [Chthoniobacteraceae bacterium]|jgi:rfaE bifunctional protein kinase chain/domain|nr:PfkB family carbohydrate kinase [Chthoniobacteraceae bacterium]
MTPARFDEITGRYASLRVAVLGDYCLDRYLEIDPSKQEISIETGLPVHHVMSVRAQAGGAGTVVNNLSALGLGEIHAIGFCGEDGEGYELQRALRQTRGVALSGFHVSPEARTFTYCKPILVTPGEPPQELNRLDSRNWEATPQSVEAALRSAIREIGPQVQLMIVMEQVDRGETGAVTTLVREAIVGCMGKFPQLPVIADSRRGLADYCHFIFKMNLAELGALLCARSLARNDAGPAALRIAREQGKPVFVTMAEHGMVGASPAGEIESVPSHPLRGPIDVVGAGDSVTANLGAALAAGATIREAMELAMAAASIVVHQLGTTGTARVEEMRGLAVR